ncbi:hypothetical protein ACFV08_01255 [Streptomyces fradiae]|uniref:Uncharacterized protein n=1 Tax=Streptomyces fradiae ATCC 10745 = DSM 40063 TaxID=1319510 RepID=A0ABQ6XNV6_STRFR|nr:hypothetical protein K701_23085 [Streptomyces fradiae ATCC 10745 = DSM 40063]KAF0647518.1 hypothetical protein K701_22375 [Streptomyces fradiae ATCC 10745 = DSM 40063]
MSPTDGRRHSRRRPALPHGPLAALDGDGRAYGIDGLVLDCPAATPPAAVSLGLPERLEDRRGLRLPEAPRSSGSRGGRSGG